MDLIQDSNTDEETVDETLPEEVDTSSLVEDTQTQPPESVYTQIRPDAPIDSDTSAVDHLVAAVTKTESSGNPNAIGPRTRSGLHAQGKMQLMLPTAKQTAENLGMDPDEVTNERLRADPELNVKLGTQYLKEMYDEFKDEKLALAAYNYGPNAVKKLQKKHGSSYANIAGHLPEETQKYVPRVLGIAYKNGKASTDSTDSNPELDTAPDDRIYRLAENVPRNAQGFASALTDVLSDPEFDLLPFPEKSRQIATLFNAKAWTPDVYPMVKKVMANYWESADPDELPNISQIVDPPPVIPSGTDGSAQIAQWKQQQVQKIYKAGISPAMFGNELDRYLADAGTNEIDAATARNRSTFGNIAGTAGNTLRNIGLGVGAAVAKPIAGIARLGGGIETANSIEAIPEEVLGRPARDYIYETDDNGYLKLNRDGSPQTKWQTDAAQTVGQVGAFLAGGAGLKALGYGAKAISGTLFGANSLSIANDSFRSVYEQTGGDSTKAYLASLFALPAAAVGTAGEYAVIAKWANPVISSLSGFNKARYLSNVFARNAGVGAASNLGQDVVSQAGEISQTGQPFNYGRATAAAVGGGLISGAVGAFGARNNRPPQAPPVPDFGEPSPPQLALPAPEGGEPRLGLPAPPVRPPLPHGDHHIALNGPYAVSPETTATIPLNEAVTSTEQADVAKKLETFQKSQKQTAVLTAEQAALIPPELFQVFEMTPMSDGISVMLAKRTTYVPRDANTIPELDTHIEALQKDLEMHPSPNQDNAVRLTAERAALRAELDQVRKDSGQPYIDTYMQRQELIKQLDAAKDSFEKAKIAGDNFAKGVHSLDVSELEVRINEFDKAHKAIVDAPARIGEVISRLERVGKQQKLVLGNPNDVKLKENNLNQLLQKRETLRREQDDPARQKANKDYEAAVGERAGILNKLGVDAPPTTDFSKGVRVGDHTILPSGDRWFVVNADGDLVGGAHDYFYDAARSLRAKPALEQTGFVMRNVKSKTALTPKDEARIAVQVEQERAKAIRAGKNKAEQEEVVRLYREGLYKKETEAAIKKAAKEDAARKKKFTKGRPGKKSTVTAESEAATDGTLSETMPGAKDPYVYSAKDKGTNAKIAPSSSSKVRRRLSHARKPLTSNYTRPIQFAEDSTEVVHPKVVFDAAQKLVSSLGKSTKIFAGSRVPKNTLGFINYMKDFIVVGKHNEISTLIHELTHAIDRVVIGKWDAQGNGDYSAIPNNVIAAAQDMADIFYGAEINKADTDLRTKEGFAMFFQHYATGQPVRKEVLDWYNTTFAKENPKVYAAMEEVKQMAFDYYNQTPATFTQSRIIPKASGTIAKIKNYLKISNIADEWTSMSRVATEIDKVANSKIKYKDVWDAIYRQASGLAEAFVDKGIVQMTDGKRYSGLSLKAAFAPAIEAGHKAELVQYLQARRDDANFKAGLETGSNEADIQKTIAGIEYKFPDVVKAANNYYDIWNRLDTIESNNSREGATFVAAQQKANLESTGATHGYYFPQPREGKGGKFNPLAKRTGTTRAVVDPIAHVRESIEARFERMGKSTAKETLVDLASSPTPSSIGNYIREVTGSKVIGLNADLDRAVSAATGEAATPSDRVLYSYLAKDLDGVTSSDFKVMPYMDGKKVRYFEVDPRIPRMFSNELPELVNSAWFKYLYRPSSQLLRPMATSFRVAFQLKQLARDPITAWRYIQSNDKIGFKDLLDIYRHTAANTINVALDKGVAKFAHEAGLRFSTSVGAVHNMHADIEKSLGNNFLSGVDRLFKNIETITSIPEQAVRLSAMQLEAKRLGITDLGKGNLTPQQQMSLILAYKRATTNFADQGYSARVLNMGVPFFTARIAEITRLPGDFKRNPGKMAALGTSMLTYGLYHALAHKDDEWYKELQPEAKMNAAWYKVNVGGVDKAMYVPLDSWSAINFGLGQAIGNKMGEDPKLPNDYVDLARAYFGQNLSPINSIYDLASPLGKEIIQQKANKDIFFNKAIVPPNLEYQDPRLQYTEYTTELAKSIGNLTNTSPLRVEHWMRSMAPAAVGATQTVESLVGLRDIAEEQRSNFLVKAFSRSGSADGIMDRSQELFTEKLLEARANKVQETPEEAAVRKSLEKINKNVSDLNTVYYGTDNQEAKEKLRKAKRDQLRLGAMLAAGQPGTATTTPVHAQAQALRKKKTKELGESLAKKKKALESGALKGDSGE